MVPRSQERSGGKDEGTRVGSKKAETKGEEVGGFGTERKQKKKKIERKNNNKK